MTVSTIGSPVNAGAVVVSATADVGDDTLAFDTTGAAVVSATVDVGDDPLAFDPSEPQAERARTTTSANPQVRTDVRIQTPQ
jgi:hypothetical protein